MIYFLALLGVLAFIMAELWSESQLVILAAGGLLGALVLLVAFDLYALGRHVYWLARGSVRGQLNRIRHSYFFTSSRRIAGVLESLAYRLNALESQIYHLSGDHSPEGGPSFLPREFREGLVMLSEGEVLDCLVSNLSRKSRADGVALIIFSDTGEPAVRLVGLDGKRYVQLLARLARTYGTRSQSGIVGHRRAEELSLIGDEFLFFGVEELYTVPFEHLTQRGLIVLAYRAYHSVSEVEKKIVAHYLRELEQDVPRLLKVKELVGRVSEAESLSKERSDFLAQMSHDIRSPLNNIKASLTFLASSEQSPEDAEIIDIAAANCDSLTELLTSILDYSRHQSGKLSAYPTEFDLSAELLSVISGFKISARLKRLELQVSTPQNLRPLICADKGQIKRVISNLISNAIKFTDQGAVLVSIEIPEGTSRVAQVVVRDSGVGMSAEQLGKLFQPFTRFQPSSREGIGLGLTVTKLLVDLNGGQISVSSTEGQGTEFRIMLPLIAAEKRAKEAAVSNSAADVGGDKSMGSWSAPQGMLEVATLIAPHLRQVAGGRSSEGSRSVSRAPAVRVLVVDDERGSAITLARNLERFGCEVLQAESLEAALDESKLRGVDCIISDLNLGDGNGRQLLESIRDRDLPLPVAIISGDTRGVIKGELMHEGAQMVFEKPLDFEQIARWIKSLVDVKAVA